MYFAKFAIFRAFFELFRHYLGLYFTAYFATIPDYFVIISLVVVQTISRVNSPLRVTWSDHGPQIEPPMCALAAGPQLPHLSSPTPNSGIPPLLLPRLRRGLRAISVPISYFVLQAPINAQAKRTRDVSGHSPRSSGRHNPRCSSRRCSPRCSSPRCSPSCSPRCSPRPCLPPYLAPLPLHSAAPSRDGGVD